MDALFKTQMACFMDEALNSIDEKNAVIDAFKSKLSNFEKKVNTLKATLETNPESFDCEKLFELLDEMNISGSCCARRIFDGMEDYEKLYRFSGDPATAAKHELSIIAKQTLGIVTFCDNGFLHIRMPLLEKRRKAYSSKKINNKHFSMHDDQLSGYVSVSFRELLSSSAVDTTDYINKNIKFLFSQNPNSPGIDLDNFDITPIINALASKTPGGDSPQNCSLALEADTEYQLPEGTYVCMAPQGVPQKSAEEIIQFWTEHLEKIPE